MFKHLIVMLLSLCILCGAASAAQPADKQAAKVQKALQKAQKKKIREEIRYFGSLRNEAVVKFARENPPRDVWTPFKGDFRISNIVCAGDYATRTVVLHLDIMPLYGGIRLFMGGNRNGTQAFAGDERYPSEDLYGRIYTLRTGQAEQITVLFRDVDPTTKRFERVDISMGLAQNIMNLISLRDVSIFWTYSDRVISNYVREKKSQSTAK